MAASDRYSTYSPSAKLVLPPVDLSDFFMMVGKSAYEDQWVDSQLVEAGLTAQKRTNADHSRIMAVAEDVRLAGAAGVIRAAVVIDVPPPPFRPLQIESDDLLADDENEDETSLITPRHYRLNKEFWDSSWQSRVKDWRASLLHVHLDEIGPALEDIYVPNSINSSTLASSRPDLCGSSMFPVIGKVKILQADKAIRRIHQIGTLPAKFWNDRSRTYPNRLADEVVLAAWRRLAIEAHTLNNLSTNVIKSIMSNYLEMQSINGDNNGLTDATLDAIARKILRQLQSRDFNSTALMNSTPIRK